MVSAASTLACVVMIPSQSLRIHLAIRDKWSFSHHLYSRSFERVDLHCRLINLGFQAVAIGIKFLSQAGVPRPLIRPWYWLVVIPSCRSVMSFLRQHTVRVSQLIYEFLKVAVIYDTRKSQGPFSHFPQGLQASWVPSHSLFDRLFRSFCQFIRIVGSRWVVCSSRRQSAPKRRQNQTKQQVESACYRMILKLPRSFQPG